MARYLAKDEYCFLWCKTCDTHRQLHGEKPKNRKIDLKEPPSCSACGDSQILWEPTDGSSSDYSFGIYAAKSEPINRLLILHGIGNSFQGMMQWSKLKTTSGTQKVSECAAQAEMLIELLETLDCGSVGGFDEGQTPTKDLFARWDWLYRKYHDPTEQRFGCDIVSYQDIKEFFSNEKPS